jgi:hypothetical protein
VTGGRGVRLAASAGVVGPAFWFTVMIVLGLTVPGYDTLTMPASALSLGGAGWVMIVNFVLLGAVEMVFAAGLWRASKDSRAGRMGAALISFAGACTLIAGPLVTDPDDALQTLHAQLHLAAVALAFTAVSAAAIVFTRHHRDSRGFAALSMLTALSVLPLFIVSEAAPPMLGLIQRVAVAIAFAWLTVLAVHTREQAARGVLRTRP